jgi:AsmA protein
VSSTTVPTAPQPHSRATRSTASPPPGPDSFDLLPVSLDLGGKQPAILEGHFDDAGYTLHLTGTVLYTSLVAMAKAVPQFGDGLQPILNQIANPNPDPAAKPAASADKPATSEQPNSAQPPSGTQDATPAAPIHIDLTATRAWGGPQTWHESTPAPARRNRK